MMAEVLSNLVITRVYSASTIYNEKNTCARRSNRPCWAMVYKYEGETVYEANGERCLSNATIP